MISQLQKSGLLLAPKSHQKHHEFPFNQSYCIFTGWCNPILDQINFWEILDRVVANPRKIARTILLSSLLFSSPVNASSEKIFNYTIYNNDDEKIGMYSYRRESLRGYDIVNSHTEIRTTFMGLTVIVKNEDSFKEKDGRIIQFTASEYKDLPLSQIRSFSVDGIYVDGTWNINTKNVQNGKVAEDKFVLKRDVRISNLSSRIPQLRKSLADSNQVFETFDPFSHKINRVSEKGVSKSKIFFQGQERILYVVENDDGDEVMQIHVFEDGVIYKVETTLGYSLLHDIEGSS